MHISCMCLKSKVAVALYAAREKQGNSLYVLKSHCANPPMLVCSLNASKAMVVAMQV